MSAHPPCIFIADDQREVREALRLLLKGEGYAAETFESRGWSAREWAAGRERLVARGLLGPDGVATDEGRALRAEVERRTDDLAAGPWQAIGAEATNRLADLLGDYWVAMLGSGLLPAQNTLGIGKV